MNKEEIEVFNYYKKETEKEEKFLKEINFKYGDKKYIQRYKNHKNILNIINKLQQENTQLQQQLKDKDEKISKVIEYCIYRQNLTIQSFGTDESKDILEILESNNED